MNQAQLAEGLPQRLVKSFANVEAEVSLDAVLLDV